MAELGKLDGRIYAITGASKGIGLCFARALAAAGAKVALLARPSAELEAAGAEIPNSMALACDVANADDVRRAFAAIGERHRKLDGLINNAASCLIHQIAESDEDEIRSQVDTNFIGPIYCIREATPLLRKAGGGDIVNISSETVRIQRPYLTLYGATKAGLESLSQGLLREMRPLGIRVMVLRLGTVAAGSLSSHWKPERLENYHKAAGDMGFANENEKRIEPETAAAMLVQMLMLPRDANLDLVELRPL